MKRLMPHLILEVDGGYKGASQSRSIGGSLETDQSFTFVEQKYINLTSGSRRGWQRQGHDGRGIAAHGLE